MYNILDVGDYFGHPVGYMFNPWVQEGVAKMKFMPESPVKLDTLVAEADLICLGGGSDVHPEIYECKNVASGVGKVPSMRDYVERAIVNLAKEADVPILGICRGAQFLCATSGGKLIQDTTHHGYTHMIKTKNDGPFVMTSTHHQMMYIPPELEPLTDVIAWTEPMSQRYLHDITNFVKPTKELEIVLFPHRRLAIQGHPEYFRPTHETVVYCRKLVKELLLS
jgi:anthranilate/para-aminobenzoate synthase component II